jgi:NIMA (never in mitosis gene a)-related kinase
LRESKIWKFFIQACLGIQYLHVRKILHRDIKTINLFMSKDETIKVGDLGVAKAMNAQFAHTMVGTPYYLSPELCEERPYNHKSDIWSLGCVLYELCSYKHPFDARNQGALLLKIMKAKFEPIPDFYSEDLRYTVCQCLQKDTSK